MTQGSGASDQGWSITMKAAQFSSFGGPEVLQIVDLPEPHAGAGEVRITVRAAGVNASDWKKRSGQMDQELPQTMGYEAAGVIDEIGDGVIGVQLGDRVVGIGGAGAAQAEYAVLSTWASIPASLDFIGAAAVPSTVETAARGLDQLGVTEGSTVMINGASGSIGSAAVQFAVHRGARVIGTGSPATHDYLRSIGAEPVAYGNGMAERVQAIVPDGVDLVLDVAGNGVLPELIALAGGAKNVITIADFAGAAHYGVRFSRGNTGRAEYAIALAMRLIDEGRFRIPVGQTFPLADVAEAHRVGESGKVRGKLVLTVDCFLGETAMSSTPDPALPATGSLSTTAGVRVPNRWLALVVLSLAQLMDIVDNTIVNIALPTAQRQLGFSIPDRQWVITGYALAFGSLLLIGGRLSDLFGRKRMFMIGVGGFAVASAVGGAATGFDVLLIARIAQGAFAAMLAPAALSLLSVTFSDNPEDRGKAFGVFGAISGAGGAIGLLLGGFLTEYLSWRWCLYVNLIFAVLAFLGAIVFLRGGTRPARVRFDLAGAVTAVLGLAGTVYGLGNAADHGWTAPATLVPAVVGVVLLGVFVVIEQRVEHPLLPVRVVVDRVRGASYLTLGIAGAGTFAIFLFLTYYLQQTLGFSPILTGVAFLPMIGGVMVGAVVSGTVLMPRTGPRPLVPAGALLAAIGLVLLTRIGTDTGYAGTVLPSLLVMGLGFGLIFGPVQNAATSGVTDSDAGIASAMVNTSQQVGGAIGTAVFSSLATLAATSYLTTHGTSHTAEATMTSYHLVFWVAAAIFTAAAIVAVILYRSGPIPTAEPASPSR